MYFLNCFFIYSLFGYILETLFSFVTHSNFKSGFFNIPFTPIYGIGAVIIIFSSNYLFKNLHINRVYETVIMFFVCMICLSFVEVLGGTLIESLFHKSFWNYSSHKYSIGKYISFEMSLIWGILSIVFVYVVHPVFKKLIIKMPLFITIIFTVVFIYGLIKTLINKKLF